MLKQLARGLALAAALLATAAFAKQPSTLPSIEQFTQSMKAEQGLLTFYQQQQHIYLAVPKKSAQYIFQSSLPWGLGSNDIGLDRGQLGATRLVHFAIHPNKVLLVQDNTQFRASSDRQEEVESVNQAFADSVIAGFTPVAESDQALLIDYTDFLLSDIHHVSETLANTEQGSYRLDPQRSSIYLPRSKAFPKNTELEAVLTYSGDAKGQYVNQVAADATALTLHSHHSFIQLPDDNYRPRKFNPQAGFWAETYQDYSVALDQPIQQQRIPRHRLRKADPIASVSEAQQPLIYYLDRGVPEPIKSALMEGASWWQQAFTAIGFDNAFQVKLLPEGADPMDVRYNVIQWVHRATRGWSYGSSVIDPRTGEIIKGHVTLGSLRVRQDIKIATALLAPFYDDRAELAQKVQAVALARIRQLAAHEVGHTLGLAHNFAASTDQRASVMDYPQPLVSLTTDNTLDVSQAYTDGLGVWDKQAIAYGYSDFGGIAEESQLLDKILAKNQALGLHFISDRDARAASGAHPLAHLWDNGSDPVTELQRLMTVRNTVIQRFDTELLAPDQPLSDLMEYWVPVYAMHRYQIEAAVKWLAGVNYDYALASESTAKATPLAASQQRRALQQLLQTLTIDNLQVPARIREKLLPLAYGQADSRERFEGRTGLVPDPVSMAEALAEHTLSLMLNPERLNRLYQQHGYQTNIPSVAEVANALLEQTRVTQQQQPLSERLRLLVVNDLIRSASDHNTAPEVQLSLQQQLQRYAVGLANQGAAADKLLASAIQQYLDSGQWRYQFTPRTLPPGSPI
ncbi:peptidase [Idiomarina tyrosinivorans]|uniref:Peptidase n=1 Tax=Idiomarina tyrosinivorans TaxID=1445662 RepID=A0A432ZPF0_9GAMM|nr:zinc-dependent metalloprotease [Idiomarina tyrosinivorans]RUO79722.1 peptidase [Idiomarina tyrosinivorans]